MTERSSAPVPSVLRWCVHALVMGLLALTVVLALAGGLEGAVGVVLATALVAGVYAVGARLPVIDRSERAAGAWLTALVAAWLVLLALTPDAIWLAFPWSLIALHLLSRPAGLLAVGAITVCAVVRGVAAHGTLNPGTFLGPIIGAAVAVAVVWGYEALQAESERRRALIAQLEATRADLATSERMAGVLAERERLAREIHDTLAQGLSSIQLLLRAAGRTLADEDASGEARARAGRYIELARQTAQEDLVEARRFVRALAPGGLDGASLPLALGRLAITTAERTGLEVSFQQVGPPMTLPTAVEVALLRIAQAAIANTINHAAAHRATITLTTMDTQVALDVVDDGIGFDPAGAFDGREARGDASGGFGLMSMRSRVAELGGTFSVESSPGGGTAVAVILDVSDP